MKKIMICAACLVFGVSLCLAGDINIDRLSEQDVKKVEDIIQRLLPVIEKRKQEGTIAAMTFKELYNLLDENAGKFLKQFQRLDLQTLDIKIPYTGTETEGLRLVRLEGQKIWDKGEFKDLPAQFLPEDVFETYLEMMSAMEMDLGRRLYVESGFRSPAYQLYLFIFYLREHDYSIRQTAKSVALPGYSEHGDSAHQAVDFVNADGIDGQDEPAEFEDLPEYQWLLKNADKFCFALSYPRDGEKGIAFEPWHWHYDSDIFPKTD